nr:hypothetical protein [Tanacetum cinerariifolium]
MQKMMMKNYTHVTLTPVNPDRQQQSSSVTSQFVSNMLNPSPDISIDSIFELTPRVDVPFTTIVEPLLLIAPTLPPTSIPTISEVQQAPAPSLTTAPSTSLQDLPNFGSLFGFDHRLKTLEANFSKFMQTNQLVEAVSSISSIVDRYLDYRMNEAVQSDRLRDEAQAKNEDFLNKLDENIQKIIKEKVKEQVKIIMDTYGDTVMLKRHHDNEDKDEEPSARSDRGSKRRRAGKELESTSAPKEKTSKTSGKSTEGSKSYQRTASESAPAEEPMHKLWMNPHIKSLRQVLLTINL